MPAKYGPSFIFDPLLKIPSAANSALAKGNFGEDLKAKVLCDDFTEMGRVAIKLIKYYAGITSSFTLSPAQIPDSLTNFVCRYLSLWSQKLSGYKSEYSMYPTPWFLALLQMLVIHCQISTEEPIQGECIKLRGKFEFVIELSIDSAVFTWPMMIHAHII